MQLYLRAFEIAISSNNSAGVFQVMLKIIELSLLIAMQLKYISIGSGMNEEIRTRYHQILETVNKLVL